MTAATLETVDVPGVVGADAPDDDVEPLPPWFIVVLVAALAGIVGFGTIGLALGVAGAFYPVPTMALGLAATIALIVAVAPWRFAAARDRATQIPAAVAFVVAAGATLFAMKHHAQHVLLDRDPGSYMVTGRWMASHHNLEFHARVGAFAHTGGLRYSSPAVYDRGGGDLYFQFSHLLPALLGEARWIGGDRAMFLTPPLLGGLGLLTFYALATRFVRPWIAVGAVAALAADLVQMHFMRDSFSELPTQVVLLGGLWLISRRGVPRPSIAFFTGLLLGATVMARIDGPLYLTAIPFALGAVALACRRGDADRRARVMSAAWLVAGVTLTTALGLIDVRLRSTAYLKQLGGRAGLQYVGLALACIVAIGIASAAPKLVTWPARAFRGRVPDIAAIAVALGLFAAWFIRPHVQHTTAYHHPYIESLQKLEGLKIDGIRRYYEDSMIWHSWYLGPLTLAAAIIGIAILTREVLQGRGGPKGLVVASFLPVTAVYIMNANIFPDQIWVMRRFLPFIIPGFILCAFVVVDRFVDLRARDARVNTVARGGAIVLLVASIAWPISTIWPVRGDTTQFGFLGPVEKICDTVGPDGAIVVLQGATLERILPQTLRSYCDVPVTVRVFDPKDPGLNAAGFEKLAADWKREGRTLFIIGDTAERIDHIIPGLKPTNQFIFINGLYLRERITRRPNGFRPQGYVVVVAPMP